MHFSGQKNSLKESIVTKLALRETTGNLQPLSRANRLRFYKKCPQRLCVPLENILDVNGELKEGHVILGFTKSGKYLISYCLKIESDDASPVPCYHYSLHWWQFDQQSPLIQVFNVALFEKDEIHQDLHIMVAESQDESMFVIYGEIYSAKDDQSRQCYVTVCAAPSSCPCNGCMSTKQCLKHSFVMYFNYDLFPPFPIFNPSISLKMEDTVLINTGDFLMALKVLTFDSCGSQFLDDLKMSFMGDSLKGDQPTEGISNMDCSQKVDKTGICFHCSSEECVHNQNAKCDHNFKRITISELSSTNGGFGSRLNCNDEEDVLCASSKPDFMRTPFENRHTVVSNFVNQLNQIHLKKAGLCDAEKDRLFSFQEYPSTNHQGGHLDATARQAETNDEKESSGLNQPINGTVGCRSMENCTGTSENGNKTQGINIVKQCINNKVADNSSTCQMESRKSELDSEILDCNENSISEKCCLDSQCRRECHTCSCSCTVSSHPPVLNNDNLTSSILKVYTASAVANNSDLNDFYEEFDMYDGSLPITVTTRNGRALKQIGKLNKNNPSSLSNDSLMKLLDSRGLSEQVLTIHQMTLDLEQCINAMIQAHEGLRDCYKSLRDYDVQVVGVCPDSGVVIVLARILVYTRQGQQPVSYGLPVSPSPVLQCTGFLFSWGVCRGEVRILKVYELDSYPEQKKYGTFNMAAKEASELRAKFSIPLSVSSFVQAFSNHTVFTGKSLKYLMHPFLPLVVVL
ncbi:DDB1- and CUL4-associated factor 15 [Acropora cervicornis]|uniref:DDB1- and CUL4-associated factor 15 n=1 Tax=Acropora cervicornis TaxID=6130 RepID=A0AAD9Q8N6_ACRCE|nr:DDB1- and CUL4-associated factor 15 [Acropora cervicornis]